MEEQIDEQKNEDDEEPIPQSQINEWIARKRVQDLMSAVIFFIWGLIINFLPGIYLNITIDWINILLQFLAMFLYIMSIVNLVRAYKNVLEKLDSETSSCIFFIVFIIMLQVFTQLATNPEARVMIVFAKIMVILCLLLVAAYSVLFVFRFFYYNPEKNVNLLECLL
jgi:hypothetical protein